MLGRQASHRWATIDVNVAREQYQAGLSLSAIAKAHRCSRRTVHRRLAEMGCVKPYKGRGTLIVSTERVVMGRKGDRQAWFKALRNRGGGVKRDEGGSEC